MKSRSVKIEFSNGASGYEIAIGDPLLNGCGDWARKCLGEDASRSVIVSNPTVFEIYGKLAENSLSNAGFNVSHWLMKDGEEHKNFRNVEKTLAFFSESGLTRTDAVIALGGGVVGDLAGFAASIYMRGVGFLQVPTTLLAMIDSSVGGKTGVNASFGKNTIGAFHQPSGVLIDPAVLSTLPSRELAAGFCEMIKHGAISGKKLLMKTSDFLAEIPLDGFSANHEKGDLRVKIGELIAANVNFKASIVAGDERESSRRTDSKSRKILNFGHTLAHALEKVTDYKYFKHGEAVGYGILYAAELSKSLALCGKEDVKLLYDVVHRVGTLPTLANIDPHEVLEAFRFDKKLVAGSLQMILLKGIGQPVIVDSSDIPKSAHSKALKRLLKV